MDERPSRKIQNLAADIFLLALFWVWVVFVSYPGFSIDWSAADELNIMVLAKDFSPASYFFDPHIYRLLSPNNLTPWAILSYDADLWVWEWLSESVPLARIVRIHQAVAAGLLLSATYCCARFWLSRSLATVTTVVFALGWPLVDGAIAPTSRHYVEGAVFGALSLLAYWSARRVSGSTARGYLFLSSLFYLGAVTAKEVFVPLPVFLFLIDDRTMGARFRTLAGHITVALCYVIWRTVMLGSTVGGYKTPLRGFAPNSFFDDGVGVLAYLPAGLFVAALSGVIFLAVLAGLCLYALYRKHWRFRDVLALCICLGVPIIPVVVMIEGFGLRPTGRYFLVIAWVLAMLFGLSISHVRSRSVRVLASAAVLVSLALSVTETLHSVSEREKELRFKSTFCGRLVLERGPDTVIFVPESGFNASYLTLLARLKNSFHPSTAPRVVDSVWLLPEDFEKRVVYDTRAIAGRCNVRRGAGTADLSRERSLIRVESDWIPEVQWLEDGIAWDAGGSNGAVSAVFINGEAKGVNLGVERGGSHVLGVRKAIWTQDVKAPAELRLARRIATGELAISGVVEVPLSYWNLETP